MPAGRFRIKSGPVTITLTPPIETAGLSVRHKEKLSQESRARIEKLLFGETTAGSPPTPPETE